MDFKQIECFVEVVRRKSFSKAAESLYMSQPAVTSNIQKLEQELGCELVERGGRGALPTAQGEIMLKYALELLKLRSSAYNEIKEKSDFEGKKLELCASSIPEEYLLPGYLNEFKNIKPLVKCAIYHGDSKEVLDMIVSGRVNIGFSGTMLEREDLRYEVIAEDAQVMIAAPDANYPDDIKLLDLVHENIILREDGSGTRKFFEDALKKLGSDILNFSSITVSSSQNAIKRMVEAGLGISFMSEIAVLNEIKQGSLKAYYVEDLYIKRNFYFVYTTMRHLSPAEEAFKDMVLQFSQRSKF